VENKKHPQNAIDERLAVCKKVQLLLSIRAFRCEKTRTGRGL